ncbi:MAG: heme ABC transporter ATP-binding protein [Chthoniobacterales bacterium]|nr:heme ABC transporter ATP-binding protein [Chthoniobacterales bacterium]
MNTLAAENLSLSRDGRTVVGGLNFSVPPGSLLVVAGPNGAGKSTLLRVLSGELPPSQGRVLFGGRDIASIPHRELARRRVFLAQQSECRLPFLACEMALLGAEAAGHRGRAARERAAAALEMAGVSHLGSRMMSKLSGGEQQRVHWARVLAQLDEQTEDRLVFLDEPVSSLDLAHQHELLARARRLAKAGATVVAVLHDLNLAARYADELLLLNDGGMQSHGAPAQVLEPETISRVFQVSAQVIAHPTDGGPLVVVKDRIPNEPAE